nr:GFA family protein [Thalassospira sp. HF15]
MTQNQSQSLSGGCQCGAVKYVLSAPPSKVYVCHCRECQLQSASAFGISAIVAPAHIKIIQGTVKTWTRSTSDGGKMPCHFCLDCGTRLFHGDLNGFEPVSVKGGSLDIQPDLSDAMHIWAKRKLEGVIIPKGVAVFDEEPEF